jgi:hypothetical protein
MRKEQIPNVLLQCSSTAVLINTKILIILLAWIDDDTVCVCVRACQRESEWKWESEWGWESEWVRLWKWLSESECERVIECVWVSEQVCVCVCVCARARACVCECESVWVCECVSVSEWVSECACVHAWVRACLHACLCEFKKDTIGLSKFWNFSYSLHRTLHWIIKSLMCMGKLNINR